jgi:hypothetical protein
VKPGGREGGWAGCQPGTRGLIRAASWFAGNVYSFNAPFYGSEAGKSLPGPITGITTAG